jgi:hypothetical protein
MTDRRLTLCPSPPDDEKLWARLLNHLYLCEEDELFRWARRVRAYVRDYPEEESA